MNIMEKRMIITPGKKGKKQNIEIFKNINGKKKHYKRNNLTKREREKIMKKEGLMFQNAFKSKKNNFLLLI